jgi:hypothetical protein
MNMEANGYRNASDVFPTRFTAIAHSSEIPRWHVPNFFSGSSKRWLADLPKYGSPELNREIRRSADGVMSIVLRPVSERLGRLGRKAHPWTKPCAVLSTLSS